MTPEEQEVWKKINSGTLYVSKHYFHHHAQKVLKSHDDITINFEESFTGTISIKTVIRKKLGIPYRGIEAKNLNTQIRELLLKKTKYDIKLEVYEDNGVFYFSEDTSITKGFDFAIINNYKNLITLRNLCFGELHYDNGEKKWDDFITKNPELESIANEIKESCPNGIDIKYLYSEEHMPLILGEIQFGNWALVYRDFFKVLQANVQNSVDFLVYVVPTGTLESTLSDGIVTFDKTVRLLQEFEKVVSVPIWVLGLDIDIEQKEVPKNDSLFPL